MSTPASLSLSHYLSGLEVYHPQTNFVPRIIGLTFFESQGKTAVSNSSLQPAADHHPLSSSSNNPPDIATNNAVIFRVDTPSDINFSIHILKENCPNYDNILSASSLWETAWSHQTTPRIVIAALPHHYVPAITQTLLRHGRAVTFTEPCRSFAVESKRWTELCEELRIDTLHHPSIHSGDGGNSSSDVSSSVKNNGAVPNTSSSATDLEGIMIAKRLGLSEDCCLGALVPEDAELVDKTWKYTAPGTVEVIRFSIRTRPTACLRIKVFNETTQQYEYKLISWVLLRHDGSMGVLHTLADYRGKGYAKAVIRYAMLVLYRYSENIIRSSSSTPSSASSIELAQKMAPFCHIKIGNTASEELFLSLGFKPVNYCTWLISNRLAPRFQLRPIDIHNPKEWNDMLTLINTSYREDDAFFVDQTRTDMLNLETMAKEGIFYVGYEWEILNENKDEPMLTEGIQDNAYPYVLDSSYSAFTQYPELRQTIKHPRETENLICLVYLKFDDGGTASPFRVLQSSTESSSTAATSTESISSSVQSQSPTVSSDHRTAHISMLTIHSKYKKIGLGQRILNFVIHTSQITYQCKYLEALVVSVKPWLQEWYRKNGFNRIGQEPWPKEIEYQLLQPCHFEIFQKRV